MLEYNGIKYELMAQKEFDADTAALDAVNEFVEQLLEEADCSMKTTMQLMVALEEIFVNIAHYAYPEGNGKADISVFTDKTSVVLRFADKGTPFDPLAKADPDITLSAEERSIGGLGIFMVKKTMDNVTYEYTDGQNILMLFKKCN